MKKPWEGMETWYRMRHRISFQNFKPEWDKFTDKPFNNETAIEFTKCFFKVNRYLLYTDFRCYVLNDAQKEEDQKFEDDHLWEYATSYIQSYIPDRTPEDLEIDQLLTIWAKTGPGPNERVRRHCVEKLDAGQMLSPPLARFVNDILIGRSTPISSKKGKDPSFNRNRDFLIATIIDYLQFYFGFKERAHYSDKRFYNPPASCVDVVGLALKSDPEICPTFETIFKAWGKWKPFFVNLFPLS
ncbi:MAG: hypothetical protein C4518_08440 [Desulfobacteraceae bacterium]|nr:MAG: hypothetical protein C4518_08440 [Desulfobacteraceae bacterium]